MSFDALIIGSGAAGVAAASALEGRRVAIVDVGHEAPKTDRLNQALYDLRETRADASAELIGTEFENLQNIAGAYLSPKLKSPFLRFVTDGWPTLSPVQTSSFEVAMSFARGGLANAWGGGVYRFTRRELAPFPFRPEELTPYYDRLTDLIGICGRDDDLTQYFGTCDGLQPPLDIDRHAQLVLDRYKRLRKRLNAMGVFIGYPRLAVLTRDKGERTSYRYEGLEFFKPNIPAIYNPSYTLRDLLDRGGVSYLPGRLALSFRETADRVEAVVKTLSTGQIDTISAKRLILAAGTLNSAKIVLASNNDRHSQLPILDNAISYVPLLAPRRFGAPQQTRFFSGAQLNVIYDGTRTGQPVQASFYNLEGILRSDFLMDLPLSLRGSLVASRYLTPALATLQLFYSDQPDPGNFLKLTDKDELEIRHSEKALGTVERVLIGAFRRLGYHGASSLCRYPPPGSCYHYAGALPMRETPEHRYETRSDGLLFGTRAVYAADAATFPSLPSKNHTFTIMANAMRIAEHVSRSLAT